MRRFFFLLQVQGKKVQLSLGKYQNGAGIYTEVLSHTLIRGCTGNFSVFGHRASCLFRKVQVQVSAGV